ncbi:unnamed protein product [Cuscuta europaea]|uniref:Uncharacterized protein n=1 Tax=Cuscuta europaea TaxID=41803 RepID=A0A9P0ZDP2_CUSEU|nr:unnamed protein product [Cuscuta europaea]
MEYPRIGRYPQNSVMSGGVPKDREVSSKLGYVRWSTQGSGGILKTRLCRVEYPRIGRYPQNLVI